MKKKIAIMQPYFFPYIGYFQLVNSVDKFVFYDDVNYIQRGWVNRNRILINGNPSYLTVPLNKASQNMLINEVRVLNGSKNLIKTVEMAYKKAPYYNEIMPLIQQVFSKEYNFISDMAIDSVKLVSNYLGFNTVFELSSEEYSSTKCLDRANRLIEISKLNKCVNYLNPINGQELYSKEEFRNNGIELNFIKSKEIRYAQFNNIFVPSLSMIDVLMFNSRFEVMSFLDQFEFI